MIWLFSTCVLMFTTKIRWMRSYDEAWMFSFLLHIIYNLGTSPTHIRCSIQLISKKGHLHVSEL